MCFVFEVSGRVSALYGSMGLIAVSWILDFISAFMCILSYIVKLLKNAAVLAASTACPLTSILTFPYPDIVLPTYLNFFCVLFFLLLVLYLSIS